MLHFQIQNPKTCFFLFSKFNVKKDQNSRVFQTFYIKTPFQIDEGSEFSEIL